MSTEFIKYFAALFFLSYMAIAFVVPSLRTYRKSGVNPVTFGGSQNAHDYIGRLFKVLLFMIIAVIGCYWFSANVYEFLLPVEYLIIDALQLSGVVICLLSLVWVCVAQWQMGASWRIGIDDQNKTKLITSGVFSKSRNPIFFGMIGTLVGFFMLLPNALMFTVMSCGYLLIQIQVRLEETFLLAQHEEAYVKYKAEVNRFF